MALNSTHSVEVGEVVVRMFEEGSDVAGLLVPLAVIVVRHHVDPVQVLADGRNIIPTNIQIYSFMALGLEFRIVQK